MTGATTDRVWIVDAVPQYTHIGYLVRPFGG
jgi:hypothetical protein